MAEKQKLEEQLLSPDYLESNEWKLIKKVEDYAKDRLNTVAHGFDHTERVFQNSLIIGLTEHADLLTLLTAALLHDVGRDIEIAIGADHADASAHEAKDFLKSVNFPVAKIKRVFEAIHGHRSSREGKHAFLESRILSDADKIDSLGAIGIARVFTFGGKINRDVQDTIVYFKKRLDKVMMQLHTDRAKRMAEERYNYCVSYLKRIEEETANIK
ncbi:MAG: HD domain-containing protein [archaeon]|jgi:uncharacterized protein|nr:phosphohydrolase [Euryarchaeota archaeon]MDP6704426.1 HD domain-containing protein [archaeon]HIK01130.1 HD domain-containing protein [Candidatus Undinarchaeales archaeon ERR594346 U_76725]|tara:strand:- start:24600 stop:25241 length:642 start_codon:yes stop_codon:yes gene_type:complete